MLCVSHSSGEGLGTGTFPSCLTAATLQGDEAAQCRRGGRGHGLGLSSPCPLSRPAAERGVVLAREGGRFRPPGSARASACSPGHGGVRGREGSCGKPGGSRHAAGSPCQPGEPRRPPGPQASVPRGKCAEDPGLPCRCGALTPRPSARRASFHSSFRSPWNPPIAMRQATAWPQCLDSRPRPWSLTDPHTSSALRLSSPLLAPTSLPSSLAPAHCHPPWTCP